MGDETKLQPDLFDDDFDRPRVFRCLGGAFIGTFNRRAGDEGEPVQRLSAYLPSEASARAALASGIWPPAEPEEP